MDNDQPLGEDVAPDSASDHADDVEIVEVSDEQIEDMDKSDDEKYGNEEDQIEYDENY